MTEAVEFAPLPPREAIEYFRSRGYAPPEQRFDWRDVWRAEHARMFVVAKATQDDVLQLIRGEVDRALSEGRTLDQFRADLRPALQRAGWWGQAIQTDPLTGEPVEVRLGTNHRLRTIYDTNMRTSMAAGRWARIQRTKAAFPFLQYRQIQRPTKRDEHAIYHEIILPVDHPAWAFIYPPNGWYCGCSVRQLTRRQMEREGLRVTDDFELETSPFVNPRSGEISDLPAGVHPGFDSNPGMAWLDVESAHEASRLGLPANWTAADRALIVEARARGLRDGVESLTLYDQAREPVGGIIDWSRGQASSVNLSRAMRVALDDDAAQLVAIHNHPASTAPSWPDQAMLLHYTGLRQIVVVGHDGSLYRVERRTPKAVPRDLVRGVGEDVEAALIDAIRGGEISQLEAGQLRSHITSLAIERVGATTYSYQMSFRMQQVADRNADLITRIVDWLGG
jgi:hypothetical protein